jgi:hypothetical protein
MLENMTAEIIHCYERARLAREKAERALNDGFKAEFIEAEKRWLALAYSYERQHQLSRTVAEFARRRNAGVIVRMLREQGGAFDPEVLGRLDVAYHAVLHQLGLCDREDRATLMVAKRIIDLAAQGERDPERLTAETVAALKRASPSRLYSAAQCKEYARLCREMTDRMPAAEHKRTLSKLADAWDEVARQAANR